MFANRNPIYEKYKSLKAGVYTIEGIIGVGKTTLGKSLEDFLNKNGLKAKFFPEYVNKKLLGQYISNMPKYAYGFQMFMLAKRIETYRQAELFASTGGIALIDRSILGDNTFCDMQLQNGNITPEEYQIYLDVMKHEIQLTPSASIYLRCSTDISLERIKKRGIKEEINGYSVEYLQQLNDAYENTISKCNNVKHVIIDWNNPQDIVDGRLSDIFILSILDFLL